MIFALALFFRIYAISMNYNIHIDEACSFVMATGANKLDDNKAFKIRYDKFNFETSKNYSAKQLQKALFETDKSYASLINDLKTLRNNNMDRPHPILYYSILRIWNSTLGEFEYNKYLAHARSLNLIFFALSFFFMFKLLSLIKDDKRFISLGLFFAFLNTGGIMLDTMAREYAMQETGYILATYLALLICKNIAKNNEIKIFNFIIYSFCFSLFLLSGYLSIIYTLMLYSIIFGFCIFYKRKKFCFGAFFILTLTLLFTIIIYPDYFNIKFDNEHYSNTVDITKNFIQWFGFKYHVLIENFSKYLFYNGLVIFCAAIYLIFPSKEFYIQKGLSSKDISCIIVLIVLSFIWLLGANTFQPYNFARYTMPCVTIVSMLYILFSYRFKLFFLSVVVLANLIVANSNIKDGVIIDNDRIEYEFNNKMLYKIKGYIKYEFKKNIPENYTVEENIPIVFVNAPNYVLSQYLFANVDKDNIIRFEKKVPEKNYIFKKYILIGKANIEDNDHIIRNQVPVYFMDNN